MRAVGISLGLSHGMTTRIFWTSRVTLRLRECHDLGRSLIRAIPRRLHEEVAVASKPSAGTDSSNSPRSANQSQV